MACIDVDSLAQYERDAKEGRADALYNLGRISDALESYERATELDPQNAECWYEYGETLYEEGRFADSLVAFHGRA